VVRPTGYIILRRLTWITLQLPTIVFKTTSRGYYPIASLTISVKNLHKNSVKYTFRLDFPVTYGENRRITPPRPHFFIWKISGCDRVSLKTWKANSGLNNTWTKQVIRTASGWPRGKERGSKAVKSRGIAVEKSNLTTRPPFFNL